MAKPNTNKRAGLPPEDRAHGAKIHPKKRCCGGADRSHNSNLNDPKSRADEIFSNFGAVTCTVLSFLTIRELLVVSSTCKTLRDGISHAHVVRAALLHGGSSKISAEHLGRLLRRGTIWTPSPMRLLRLVNGRRCEICSGVVMRRSYYGVMLSNYVRFVTPDFGLFVCRRGCLEKKLLQAVSEREDSRIYALLDHPRVACASNSSGRPRAMLRDAVFCDATGTPCGPLLTRPRLEELLKQQEQQEGGRNNNDARALLEKLLQDLDSQDTHRHHVPQILQIIVDMEEVASQREQERLQERKQQKESASERALVHRQEKIRALVDQLKQELHKEGVAANWPNFLLQHYDNTFLGEPTIIKSHPVKFRVAFVDQLLKAYVQAPSKATPKKRRELKDALLERSRLLVSSNFHTLSSLSQTDPFERALRAGFALRLPGGRHLALVHEGTLEKLRDGGDVAAALATLRDPRFLDQRYYTATGEGLVAQFLAPLIASTVMLPGGVGGGIPQPPPQPQPPSPPPQQQNSGEVALALRLFRFVHSQQSELDLRTRFQVCMDRFPEVYQQVLDFCGSSEVQAWNNKKEQDEGFSRAQIRRITEQYVWSPSLRADYALIKLAAEREYSKLLEHIWRREVPQRRA